ncbi:MAG: CRISPR system precrRNA processing endoribonuclease RAMP protein Cas6, partial [Candidatus Thorarchaeota archaeon]
MTGITTQINFNAYTFAFHLRALNPNTILPPFTGHQVRGATLHLIQSANPEISALLHRKNDVRPYSVTTLFNPSGPLSRTSQGMVILDPGRPVVFRLNTVNPQVNQAIIQGILSLTDTTITLANQSFLLERVGFERHQYTEQTLIPSPLAPHFSIQFLTPTQFNRMSSSQIALFPEPRLIFGNLIRIATALEIFTVIVDPSQFIQFVTDNVHPRAYKLRTREVAMGKALRFVGFTGWCRFKILNPSDPNARLLPVLLTLG